MKSKTCVIVTQHLSHYRAAVYSGLQRESDYHVRFVAGRDGRVTDIPEIPEGVLDDVTRLTETWLPLGLIWQHGLSRLIRRTSPDVVIFLGDFKFLSTWIAAMVARSRGARVFFWTIGWRRPDRHRVVSFVRKKFYHLADTLLLYGEDGLRFGIAAGYPAEKMTIIGNSIAADPENLSPQDIEHAGDLPWIREVQQSPQRLWVGAVARLTPEKRFDLLIRSVHAIRAGEGLDVGVLLVGEGPERKKLEGLVDSLGVPAIIPGAAYSPSALAQVYRHLRITVLPERAGLTVVQSLAHGVPVVTVDDPSRQVPEFRAVVPGVTGDLYRASDPKDLQESILRWLKVPLNEASDLAKRCRAEVRINWSSQAQVQRILEAIQETPGAAR